MIKIETHAIENIKVGQVYRCGDKRIEVVGMEGNFPVCRMYGVPGLPEGYEYIASLGIGETWELDTTPAISGTHQSVKYTIVAKNFSFNAANFVNELNDYVSLYDTIEEAKEDDFDEESEVIVKVIIDYRIEEVQETKPTFESELAELKKKYNVE